MSSYWYKEEFSTAKSGGVLILLKSAQLSMQTGQQLLSTKIILRFGTKVQKIGHLVGALENQPVILSTKIIWSTYQILLKAGFLKIKFGSCAYRN